MEQYPSKMQNALLEDCLFVCSYVQLVLCCVAALSSDKLGIGNELKAAWC